MGIVNMTNDKNQMCIDSCNRCAQACMECMMMCLNEPDASSRVKCISTLHECVCICKETSSFMSMNARHAMDLCKLCGIICSECAQECDIFSDDHCQKCAAECTSCAKVCNEMAGM